MVKIMVRRDVSVVWIAKNPVLASGEPGFEIDTGKVKLGNGISRWTELEYLLPESAIVALIQETIDETLAEMGTVGGGSGGSDVDPVALQAHINAVAPHPAYDDGPSLLLQYQNAKV